ncbi:MAG TPA: hypothetical protein DHV28_07920 [Ignavibacteriales bacterium]|nr:hypothetical protein [Ignavibacteriales bacterium]
MKPQKIFVLLLLISFQKLVFTQITVLDDFETTTGWNFIKADGVNLFISGDTGLHGKAVKFDYDFTKGTGYGGIQKFFPIDLPENYEFTFNLKADSPPNNFEIKFIDSSGNNVWWVNNRNYDFPKDWKKIRVKKRHINFAWGPTEDHSLKRIDRIEFTVASFVGGKGTVWIDDLKFEPLPPETNVYPQPIVTASSMSFNKLPGMVIDNLPNTYWQSSGAKNQFITIDFKTRREFGGLKIDWVKDLQARAFEILTSEDGISWERVYSVSSNNSNVSFIKLSEEETRFIKINLVKSNSEKSYGINEIRFLDIKNSLTQNDFLIYTAKNSPVGYYPRYFLEQASYWTISGVNNDLKEALINEDGMVEVDKASFSIEPMLKINDKIFNWSNVKSYQSLEDNYLPIPKVDWNLDSINLNITTFSNGKANENSVLYIRYKIQNNFFGPQKVKLYLLIRPFQVNPYYQFLNLTGGAGKIYSIEASDNKIFVNDDKMVIPITKYNSFSASSFDEGNIVEQIMADKLISDKSVIDNNNLAGGVIEYEFDILPDRQKTVYVAIPFYSPESLSENLTETIVEKKLEETKNFWKSKINHIKFNLPESAERIVNTYKSNLAYILINKDKAGIQPGSRSYERSWIRDGSLTSSALLKSGITNEVKDFINWYTDHQYESGKVPCVVDSRGPDPVPENDSHGEMIYLIREYFNFTKDTVFLRSKNENVKKAVEYIESLIAERSTDHFKNGNDSVRAYFGLVPESISHEGYSAKPMHSYWDDFFTLKGLKDAAEIQKILGEKESYEKIKKLRDTFKVNLYNSLNLAMKIRKINYIPGCVELGDFDATSTTIALAPCNEFENLPKPQIYNTFDKYFEFFENRRDGKIDWVNYTPYENRIIGSFIQLNQPERTYQLIDYFLNDQHPQNWNAFAEVVWKDKREPKFIGDMPHTWVGSDFINAIRSMFVYENEYDKSLVLASALYQSADGRWIDTPDGISIENLPTYYGEISYSIKKENDKYIFSIYGDIRLPENGIKIKNFNGSKLPQNVTLNGKQIKTFSRDEIVVKEFPAEVVIDYAK